MLKKVHVDGTTPYIGKVVRILCGQFKYRLDVVATETSDQVAVVHVTLSHDRKRDQLRARLTELGWAHTYNDHGDKPTTHLRTVTVPVTIIL